MHTPHRSLISHNFLVGNCTLSNEGLTARCLFFQSHHSRSLCQLRDWWCLYSPRMPSLCLCCHYSSIKSIKTFYLRWNSDHKASRSLSFFLRPTELALVASDGAMLSEMRHRWSMLLFSCPWCVITAVYERKPKQSLGCFTCYLLSKLWLLYSMYMLFLVVLCVCGGWTALSQSSCDCFCHSFNLVFLYYIQHVANNVGVWKCGCEQVFAVISVQSN